MKQGQMRPLKPMRVGVKASEAVPRWINMSAQHLQNLRPKLLAPECGQTAKDLAWESGEGAFYGHLCGQQLHAR